MENTDRIEIVLGDITTQTVDAIVNAANSSLLGGGGVDGAIHRAAGPELLEACRKCNGCPTGEARVTPGFKLHARFIIHTVGPVWYGGAHNEDALLARCYRNSLRLAVKHSITTIAFPSISTGAYGFPFTRATTIALNEIKSFLEGNHSIGKITMVCFDRDSYDVMKSVSDEIFHRK